jgi:DNA-directed RNA polymerase specialized sigma24 family protein
MSICKNLWRSEHRRRSKFTGFSEESTGQLTDEPARDLSQQNHSIAHYMEALGQKCKDILIDFYYHNLRMDQIAAKHLYRNIHTATVQKFKCLERLRKSVSSFSINQFLT